MTRGRKVLTSLGALGIGLVVGILGAFVQAHRSILIFGDRYLVIPWGLLIVLAVLLVAIRGLALTSRSRATGWLILAGWITITVFLASETAGGDIAVSAGARQWAYLLAGAILGSAVATLPPQPLRPEASEPRDPSDLGS